MQGLDWNPKSKEKRRLLELCDIWYELHGKNLNDKGRKNKLVSIVSALGNPVYSKLSQKDFLRYRAARLERGISICTVNKELTYLKALFNFLISSEIIDSNPLANTKKLKETQQGLRYLESNEISQELFETIKDYLLEHQRVNPSYEAFERAIKVAEIKLPKGQMTHVMRHSLPAIILKMAVISWNSGIIGAQHY